MPDLADLINEATAQQTFENMKNLCNQLEYEVPKGSGIKYKRKMLKPQMIIDIQELALGLNGKPDAEGKLVPPTPSERMEIIKRQAEICLTPPDGKTFDELWAETDAAKMEIIVGACILISKGFQQV